MNPDRGLFSIAGRDIEGVINDFIAFEGLIEERLNFNIVENARFYEINFEGLANTGNDPTRMISNVYQDSGLLSTISKTLNMTAANFGIRIVQQNSYTNH